MTKKSLVVLDYGSGNLRSAQRALERVGATVEVTSDPAAAAAADGLVVPGVGAYEACMAGLRGIGGEKIIADRLAAGRPVLGICVGMQILFARGVEFRVETKGCAQWPGSVIASGRGDSAHGLERGGRRAGSSLFGLDADASSFVHSMLHSGGRVTTTRCSPGRPTTCRSWPPSRTVRWPPHSFIRRRVATPARRC